MGEEKKEITQRLDFGMIGGREWYHSSKVLKLYGNLNFKSATVEELGICNENTWKWGYDWRIFWLEWEGVPQVSLIVCQ